jgi:23S rRNA pseudouridine1911/1915/1917 synthase
VSIKPRKAPRRVKKYPKPYNIVFEDAHILVADKAPGLLTVPLPDKHSRNLKDLLNDYLASQKRRALTVHRIDRYTSGLVLFAKNHKA